MVKLFGNSGVYSLVNTELTPVLTCSTATCATATQIKTKLAVVTCDTQGLEHRSGRRLVGGTFYSELRICLTTESKSKAATKERPTKAVELINQMEGGSS
ncbi:hypothetical protein [Candidatus Bathycorpusculum sp.]|jgi:hypothetical protein|uniref:hypothetical protein n=1 Tax=Candidatus Bathycorpusculum sp. TaxID=2994959 RepID=UPI00282B67A2|nr:hypothetical protein [Candidatus Termitimicrobium sp.]MCL2686314.1 hypothetical protein [Candidatus Termitimicrobium sp.]